MGDNQLYIISTLLLLYEDNDRVIMKTSVQRDAVHSPKELIYRLSVCRGPLQKRDNCNRDNLSVFFSIFLAKNISCDPHLNRLLVEMVLWRGYTMCLMEKYRTYTERSN